MQQPGIGGSVAALMRSPAFQHPNPYITILCFLLCSNGLYYRISLHLNLKNMDFIDYDVDYNYNPQTTPHHSSPQTDILSSYKCVLLNYPINSTSSVITYYSLWLLKSDPLLPPSEFIPLQHVAYQLSQVILCVYAIVCKSSVWGFIGLSCYCLVEGLWGLLVLKGVDVTFWKGVVLVVVLLRLCGICFFGGSRRGGERGRKVGGLKRGIVVGSGGKVVGDEEVREVYLRLFAPVKVSYKQFLKVIKVKRGISTLSCGENYSVEKKSRVESLALLISGRLVVCQGGKPLHVILPFQFVDSPEYFGVATDELFQVTITALEESKLLVWHRDKLRLTIMPDPFLSTIFQHILSRDVCRKLISVSDTMVTTPTTTYSTTPTTGTTTAISSSSSTQQIPSNGTSNGQASTLLTTLTPSHTNTTTTTAQQPIIMLRKEKYSYQSTYLSSLSEEKTNGGSKIGFEEVEDEDVDEDEEEKIMDAVVCSDISSLLGCSDVEGRGQLVEK